MFLYLNSLTNYYSVSSAPMANALLGMIEQRVMDEEKE
jgi:hypothetical protein